MSHDLGYRTRVRALLFGAGLPVASMRVWLSHARSGFLLYCANPTFYFSTKVYILSPSSAVPVTGRDGKMEKMAIPLVLNLEKEYGRQFSSYSIKRRAVVLGCGQLTSELCQTLAEKRWVTWQVIGVVKRSCQDVR